MTVSKVSRVWAWAVRSQALSLLKASSIGSKSGEQASNFLHVSTTILFETSPEHRLNWPKLGATLAGLLLALAVA